MRKPNRQLRPNHQQNIAQLRKPPRQLRPPHRLHPRLRRLQSAVTRKRRPRRERARPHRDRLRRRQLVRPRRSILAQKLRQRRVHPRQLHLANSRLAICSSPKLLLLPVLRRPRLRLQVVRVHRLRVGSRQRAAAMVLFGSIPKRMFTTRNARVFTARLRRVNT